MMKKITIVFAALLFIVNAMAQAPQKMTYQAVVRNSSNALVVSSPIGIRVSLLQGSATAAPVYVETHTTQTNQNGLLDIQIGGGTIVSGAYINGIYWAAGPYFLKTEIDPSGAANYTITSTSELLSVPYSMYSLTSGNVINSAMDFVGAYAPDNTGGGIPIAAYILINYLGQDKVSVWIQYFISPDYLELTLYGTISGNTITFPAGNMLSMHGSGTKVGNNFNFTLSTNNGFFGAFSSIKQ